MLVYVCNQHTANSTAVCILSVHREAIFPFHTLFTTCCSHSANSVHLLCNDEIEMQILSLGFFFPLNTENTGYGFSFYLNFPFQFGANLNCA